MVIDFGCVKLRILWIKFRFSRGKVYMVVGYYPNKGNGEEKGEFWNDLDRIMDKIKNGYRICVLENLNRWIGDGVKARITGAFEVPER